MTWYEKIFLSLLICYSAMYSSVEEWWLNEVCVACMFVLMILFVALGGKKND